MTEKEYNLLDERWILAVNEDGRMDAYSLEGIFAEAHKLKRLSGEIPTQDAAVFRLLLAILYAVYQNHDENGHDMNMSTEDDAFSRWNALWQKGRFDADVISAYLESYRDRFYLFHPTRPFYQIPLDQVPTEGDRGWCRMAKYNGELSQSDNKPRIFSPISGVEMEQMEFAEAVRWLINMNAFDDVSFKPSTRETKKPSCSSGWMGSIAPIIVEGSDLFRTLLLNLVLTSDDYEPFPIGIPAWEHESCKVEERTPIPMPESPVEMLTLQSRRIALRRSDQKVTMCYRNGGDLVETENAFTEQMTVWCQDKKGNFIPRKHTPSRFLWRDYQSIMLKNMESGKNRLPGVIRWIRELDDRELIDPQTVTVSIVGVQYDSNKGSITHFMQDSITFSGGLLADFNEEWNVRIADSVKLTDGSVTTFTAYVKDMCDICGYSDKTKQMILKDATIRAYLGIDGPFRQWIRSIDPAMDDMDDKVGEWSEKVYRIMRAQAETILEEAGQRALTGNGEMSVFTAFRKFSGKLYGKTHGGADNE